MADGVQIQLETTLPALRDGLHAGVFQKKEVQTIVAQRTKFEYRLRSRGVAANVFLRYVEYEAKLHKLVHKRIRKIESGQAQAHAQARDSKHKPKANEIRHDGPKRIHHIFNRAVQKHPYDTDLWQRFVDSAIELRSTKQVPQILARAVRLCPSHAAFWVQAANWELVTNENATKAREIMRQAISMNRTHAEASTMATTRTGTAPDAPADNLAAVHTLGTLWYEWFRIEVYHVRALRIMREIDSKAKQQQAQKQNNDNDDDDDSKKTATTKDDDDDNNNNDSPVLRYELALSVAQEAISRRPKDHAMIQRMMQVLVGGDTAAAAAAEESRLVQFLEQKLKECAGCADLSSK